jgi:hypothetical protein
MAMRSIMIPFGAELAELVRLALLENRAPLTRAKCG